MVNKVLENGNLVVKIPTILRGISGRKRIIAPEQKMDGKDPLSLALARGFRWQKYIDTGKFKNIHELAYSIGQDPGIVSRTIRLTMLAPEVIHRIIVGDVPPHVNLSTLRGSLPILWTEQIKLLLNK